VKEKKVLVARHSKIGQNIVVFKLFESRGNSKSAKWGKELLHM
jgi:hypothetical protein